ncbi:MAG: rhodanese-like domain-containing protein [Candidatus Kapaibacterium sp.]
MKLNTNKKLALVAIAFAVVAIFIGSPEQGKTVEVDTEEIARTIKYQQDSVCIRTVADYLVEGRADFTIVDIRDEEKYSEYHIPTARNIPLGDIGNPDLLRNQKIYIYSDNDVRTAQAWFILKASGYRDVYMIYGGIDAWKSKILFPELPDEPGVLDKPEYAKIAEMAKFFGGRPKLASGGEIEKDVSDIEMPEIRQPVQVEVKRQKPAKRQGC